MKSNTSKNTRSVGVLAHRRPHQKLTCHALIGSIDAHNPNVPGFYAGRNAKEII